MSAHPYRLRHPSKRMAWLGAVVLLLAGAPASGRVDPLLDDNAGYHAPVPLGLPKPHQPLDPAAVRLGKRLFFDPRLSADASVSCATCHAPREGFTQNGAAKPVGIGGRALRRNAPSLYNVAFAETLFHDGREDDLAEQIWSVLLAPNEMGNRTRAEVTQRIARLDDYAATFEPSFAQSTREDHLGTAITAYQRSLLSGDSPFDRWYFGGDTYAVGPMEKLGFELFVRSDCASCHELATGWALFTDHQFHNTGIGLLEARARSTPRDTGRHEVTGLDEDRWRYKTPGLRNVALTAPYMHDGSLPTLAAVVEYYAQGGAGHAQQDSRVRPLSLTEDQRHAMVAFLVSLTGSNADNLASDTPVTNAGDLPDG